MLYFNRFELIFYLGVGFIIFTFVLLVKYRFEEDDRIDLNEHGVLLLFYLLLLVVSIYIWRILFEMIFSSELIQLFQKDLKGIDG